METVNFVHMADGTADNLQVVTCLATRAMVLVHAGNTGKYGVRGRLVIDLNA